jgi:hypothetical protein
MPFGPISVDIIRQLAKAHFPHSNDLWKFGDPFLTQLALIVLMSNSEVVPQQFNHRQISRGRAMRERKCFQNHAFTSCHGLEL